MVSARPSSRPRRALWPTTRRGRRTWAAKCSARSSDRHRFETTTEATMSRVGKKPVAVPSGVTATVNGQLVKVKGSKGELSFVVPENVSVAMENGSVAVNPRDETKDARAKWGMSRSQVANLVEGVTKGFERKLEINGVGYRAAVAG